MVHAWIDEGTVSALLYSKFSVSFALISTKRRYYCRRTNSMKPSIAAHMCVDADRSGRRVLSADFRASCVMFEEGSPLALADAIGRKVLGARPVTKLTVTCTNSAHPTHSVCSAASPARSVVLTLTGEASGFTCSSQGCARRRLRTFLPTFSVGLWSGPLPPRLRENTPSQCW